VENSIFLVTAERAFTLFSFVLTQMKKNIQFSETPQNYEHYTCIWTSYGLWNNFPLHKFWDIPFRNVWIRWL